MPAMREQTSKRGDHAASAAGSRKRPPSSADDPIGGGSELQVVGDEEGSSPDGQPFDRGDHERGARLVEIGRGLVEQDERRVAEKRARDREPPSLPGGQLPPTVTDERLVPMRQLDDETVRSGQLRGQTDAIVVGRGIAEPDVLGDGPAKERRPLRDVRERVAAMRPRSTCRKVLAADEDPPGGRLGEAQEQRQEVLFPPPLAPTSATVSPGSSSSSTPSRTSTSRDRVARTRRPRTESARLRAPRLGGVEPCTDRRRAGPIDEVEHALRDRARRRRSRGTAAARFRSGR